MIEIMCQILLLHDYWHSIWIIRIQEVVAFDMCEGKVGMTPQKIIRHYALYLSNILEWIERILVLSILRPAIFILDDILCISFSSRFMYEIQEIVLSMKKEYYLHSKYHRCNT